MSDEVIPTQEPAPVPETIPEIPTLPTPVENEPTEIIPPIEPTLPTPVESPLPEPEPEPQPELAPEIPKEEIIKSSEPTELPEPSELPEPEEEKLVEEKTVEEKPVEEKQATVEEPEPVPKEEPTVQKEEPTTPKEEPVDKNGMTPTIRAYLMGLLVKANAAVQTKKQKNLKKLITLFDTMPKVQNNDVEKFLHLKDAMATRYLNMLLKEGKIRREGTGSATRYYKL